VGDVDPDRRAGKPGLRRAAGRPLRHAGWREGRLVYAVDQRHPRRRHHLAPDPAAGRALRGTGERRLRQDGRLRQGPGTAP
nr:hypothetical protein [Tanacetum cinerariifolium]